MQEQTSAESKAGIEVPVCRVVRSFHTLSLLHWLKDRLIHPTTLESREPEVGG